MVHDARIRIGAPNAVQLGPTEVVLGSVPFYIALTKIVPLDETWAPTIQQCEERATEIEAELARTRLPTGQVPPGMLAEASRAQV